MTAPEPHRYWEDLVIGEEFISAPRTVTREEIVDFASRYDPQYFHMDPEQARRSHFGEVVASGIHILALWRILDHQILGDVRWMCGIGWDKLRWNHPLKAGDTVRAYARCLDKRPSNSNPERGVAVYRYALLNQNDEQVYFCDSTNLVERRPPARKN